MKLYRTAVSYVVEEESRFYQGDDTAWDVLVARDDLAHFLQSSVAKLSPVDPLSPSLMLAPIGSQEVWAAGVTYYRSRDARMEEAKSAGGGDFYDRVYAADRPELFMKATAHRVVGPNQKVAIRDDAKWSVPEPELTLLIAPAAARTSQYSRIPLSP